MSGFFSKIFPISTPLPRPQVPEGVTRICVSGFGISHHTGRARAIASAIADKYPDKYETWYYFDTRGFRPSFLDSIKSEISSSADDGGVLSDESKTILSEHNASPFCWLEETSTTTNKKKLFTPIGGRDSLCDWAKKTFADNDTNGDGDGDDTTTKNDNNNESIISLCRSEPSHWKEIKFDATTPGTTKTETYNI